MQYLLVPTVDQQVEVVRLVSGTREMSQRLLTGTFSFAKYFLSLFIYQIKNAKHKAQAYIL